MHRVEVNIRPENVASLRVVEHLRFRDEGVRERYLHINGGWRDHRTFALTADELGGRRVARPVDGGAVRVLRAVRHTRHTRHISDTPLPVRDRGRTTAYRRSRAAQQPHLLRDRGDLGGLPHPALGPAPRTPRHRPLGRPVQRGDESARATQPPPGHDARRGDPARPRRPRPRRSAAAPSARRSGPATEPPVPPVPPVPRTGLGASGSPAGPVHPVPPIELVPHRTTTQVLLRRARGVFFLAALVAVPATLILSAAHILKWLSLALAVTALVVAVVWLRVSALQEQKARHARRAELRRLERLRAVAAPVPMVQPGPTGPRGSTGRPSSGPPWRRCRPPSPPRRSRRRPTPDVDPDAWQPVPVPPPTYTLKEPAYRPELGSAARADRGRGRRDRGHGRRCPAAGSSGAELPTAGLSTAGPSTAGLCHCWTLPLAWRLVPEPMSSATAAGLSSRPIRGQQRDPSTHREPS